MTFPPLSFSSTVISDEREGAVLVLIVSGDSPAVAGSFTIDPALLTTIGFTGRAEQHGTVVIEGRRVDLVGVGAEVTARSVRRAVGSAVLKADFGGTLHIDVPRDQILAAAEGAALGRYRFSAYKGAGTPTTPDVPAIVLHAEELSDDAGRDAIERAAIIGDSVALVKDLSNTPGRDLPPAVFAERARDAVADLGIEVSVWDEDDLESGGFGGIFGVGQGSSRPPRLVKLSYQPDAATRHLAVVGKGITFDSGGLSLKPATSMLGMKYDMAGAATALGTIVAAAKLGVQTRITAWLCVAENMPSGTAIRPNDVLTMKNGKTVEVTNTDAEGRLVLADGLSMASDEQPDAIVDIATLTGAVLVALGRRTAAVIGSADLTQQVIALGTDADEALWELPIPEEVRDSLKSDIADMINTKLQGVAGTLAAAAFLREFVGHRDGTDKQIPWAHFDIAGTGDNPEAPHGYTGKGATGFALRTLLALAEQFARP